MQDNSIFNPIEEYIKGMDVVNKPNAFYPSMASCRNTITNKISGKCLRSMWYQWKEVPITNHKTYRTWLSAELGNAWEKAFLDAYDKRGLLKYRGVKRFAYVWGLPISYKLDGMTKLKEVVECKSCYGRSFFYDISHQPREHDLPQIMVYLGLTGSDVCILPYGSRDDTAQRVGYKITKQEIEKRGVLLSGIFQRWKILKFYLDNNLLPPRDFDLFNDWQCSYCPWFREPACYGKAEIDFYFNNKKQPKKKKEVNNDGRKRF